MNSILKFFIPVLILGVCLTACSQKNSLERLSEEWGTPVEKLVKELQEGGFEVEGTNPRITKEMEKYLLNRQIKAREDSLYGVNNEKPFDANQAEKLVNIYLAYADKFPDDENAIHYLFKSGELYRTMKMPEKAIEIYKRIYDNYPDDPKRPYSLFMQAFIYEEDIRNLDKARAIYQEFLEKYPDHELADDAIFSIKFLGKPPEEILKEMTSDTTSLP